MSDKIIKFPNQIQDYGDLFHTVMDICIDVQFEGKCHIDATAEILEIVEKYYVKNKTAQ